MQIQTVVHMMFEMLKILNSLLQSEEKKIVLN